MTRKNLTKPQNFLWNFDLKNLIFELLNLLIPLAVQPFLIRIFSICNAIVSSAQVLSDNHSPLTSTFVKSIEQKSDASFFKSLLFIILKGEQNAFQKNNPLDFYVRLFNRVSHFFINKGVKVFGTKHYAKSFKGLNFTTCYGFRVEDLHFPFDVNLAIVILVQLQ